MVLTPEQINELIGLVATTTPDELDCDGCFEQVAEFAETELTGKSRSDAMQAVAVHLQNCPCCENEFQTLLAALRDS